VVEVIHQCADHPAGLYDLDELADELGDQERAS
jgi:hypothetical protein